MTFGRYSLAAAVIAVALAEALAIALFLLVPGKWEFWLVAGLAMPTFWIAAELLSRNKQSLRLAVAYAAVMIAVSEALAVAKALAFIAPDNEGVALRFIGIASGLVIVFYGNIAPKQAACVDPASPNAGRQQAFQRYFGWVLFLAGLANTLVWVLAPIKQAALWSMIPLLAAIFLVAFRIISSRAARENRA
jgi:hypothetical protein